MNDSQRLYKAYLDLNLDGSWIGLEQEERGADDLYFCTPVGAQIIGWDNGIHSSPEEMEYAARPEVVRTLNAIRTGLGIEPAERPFERIKAIQKDFPYDRIVFSDEFYEITGLENPKNPE